VGGNPIDNNMTTNSLFKDSIHLSNLKDIGFKESQGLESNAGWFSHIEANQILQNPMIGPHIEDTIINLSIIHSWD